MHCQFLNPPQYLSIVSQFQSTLAQHTSRKTSPSTRQQLTVRHGAMLGLCAFVTAFPHTVPDFVPALLVYLGDLLHAKQPIPGTTPQLVVGGFKMCNVSATIKKSLQSFKRTHQDNWSEHKEAFTEDQLIDLTNLLVSPSYYA